ncbi:MAG: aldehyde dehydrogenase family protein [Actinomycetes bacterium]
MTDFAERASRYAASDRRSWATDWVKTAGRVYRDGQWHSARHETTTVRSNPANGVVLGEIPNSSSDDVDAAVEAARRAGAHGSAWRTMTRRNRANTMRAIGNLVREYQDELATLITLENGKLLSESLDDDMPDTADIFDYYAGWTDKFYGETAPVEGSALNYTVHEPIGVCALIVPWNFPLLLAAWKIAPALAMGNTVVVKPSPFTPFSLLRFVDIVHESGLLPAGVLNSVLGDAETGRLLTTHRGVDKVSFTGSTNVGRAILAGIADSNLAPITLELGGKSPNIVFDDVNDLEGCIDRSFHLMFSQKGEKCSEPTRFILQRGIHDTFVAGLVARAEAVTCGDPFDPSSTQGPQCTESQLVRCLDAIDGATSGVDKTARLQAGGFRDETGSNVDGLFMRPTVFDQVDPTSSLARDEVFGPVLAVMSFDDEDHAVALANDTEYGLAAGVSSGDVNRARRVADRLDAGQVFINRYGQYDFASPFGGFKRSGWGKEMGIHSLSGYTRTKSIWIADS